MFGTILKETNSSLHEGKPFCHSIYMKKVMKLLAFIFEQPSYAVICVTYSFTIIPLGKRELVALILMSSGFHVAVIILWRGLVFSMWLWHFLTILTYFLLMETVQ